MNIKTKLLFVNGAQFGHSSGHYYYCKYLSDNFDVSYICFDRGLNKIVLEGVEVFYIPFSGNQLSRISRFIKECITISYIKRPDILFVTYFNICFLLTVLCKSNRKVLDIRTGSLKKNSVIRGINNFFILVQSLFYKEVVILSDSLRRKLNISKGKSRVVPLGSEIYFPGNQNFDTLNLLYVGAIGNRNIIETLQGLRLFLQNNKSNSVNITYTIVGFGSDTETSAIIDWISENNMFGRVKYVGRKTHEELIPFFVQSNVGIAFVPLKSWYNCQPLTKLFEYLLSGMLVIATDTFENRQIVNENNGILIQDTAEDFSKGLEYIYNNRKTYNSSEIRKSVETYTWPNIVSNTLKPYLLDLLKESD